MCQRLESNTITNIYIRYDCTKEANTNRVFPSDFKDKIFNNLRPNQPFRISLFSSPTFHFCSWKNESMDCLYFSVKKLLLSFHVEQAASNSILVDCGHWHIFNLVSPPSEKCRNLKIIPWESENETKNGKLNSRTKWKNVKMKLK